MTGRGAYISVHQSTTATAGDGAEELDLAFCRTWNLTAWGKEYPTMSVGWFPVVVSTAGSKPGGAARSTAAIPEDQPRKDLHL